jgi:DNA-binding CsgD family transcriptional regulator
MTVKNEYFNGIIVVIWLFLLSACTEAKKIDINYSFEAAIDAEEDPKDYEKIVFQPDKNLDLGFYNGTIWIKLELENHHTFASYVVLMGDLINRNYRFYKLDTIKRELTAVAEVADFSKNDHRTFNDPRPNFKIDLSPFETAVYYISTESDGRILQATPELMTIETYATLSKSSNVVNIIFYATIGLLLLINVFYWNTLRNRIYYFYGFYILSSCLFYAFVEGQLYGWGLSHSTIDHLMFLSIRIWIFSAILFTAKFLDIQKSSPRVYKVIKILLLFVLGGATLYQLIAYNTSIQHLHKLENLFGFIWVFLAIAMIFTSIKKRKLQAKYYLISFSFLMFFILLGLIDSHTALLSGDPFSYFKIGTIIEFSGFTFFIALIIKKNLEKASGLENELIENRKELSKMAEKLATSLESNTEKTTIEKTDLISILKILESSFSSDEQWASFESKFASLNPNFLKSVTDKHPNLTKSELRLLILIRIGYTQKEIAEMLNIAPDSAKKAKQRVRKKLNLSRSTVLSNYLSRLG